MHSTHTSAHIPQYDGADDTIPKRSKSAIKKKREKLPLKIPNLEWEKWRREILLDPTKYEPDDTSSWPLDLHQSISNTWSPIKIQPWSSQVHIALVTEELEGSPTSSANNESLDVSTNTHPIGKDDSRLSVYNLTHDQPEYSFNITGSSKIQYPVVENEQPIMSFQRYQIDPPTNSHLLDSLDANGLSHIVYQEPFFSDPRDTPRPREFGGKEFRFDKGPKIFDPIQTTDHSPIRRLYKAIDEPLLTDSSNGTSVGRIWNFGKLPISGLKALETMSKDDCVNSYPPYSQIDGPTPHLNNAFQEKISEDETEGIGLVSFALELHGIFNLRSELPRRPSARSA